MFPGNFSFDGMGGGNRLRLSRSEYLRYGGLGLLFVLLIVVYVFEFKYFDRTLNVKKLVVGSLLFGLTLGLFLGYKYRSSARDLTERFQIYTFFVFICVIFMPLFGNLSNRLLSFAPARVMEVEFVEESAFYASNYGVIKGEKIKASGYYFFFYRDGKLERIKNNKPLFPDKARGDMVPLRVKKGLWGFQLVMP